MRKRKRVLFVQGAGEGAHAADARLATALVNGLGPSYDVRYPRLPGEDQPDAAEWMAFLAAEVTRLGDGGIVVAHSAGAAALVRALADRRIGERLAGIFLIAAPFCGPGGWQIDGCEVPPDLGHRLPAAMPLFLYHGREDDIVPLAHVELYAKVLPSAVVRRIPDRDHQLNDDLSEVVEDIVRLS
jgi:predicted alpha/beta hydrolase family esterase